MYINIEVLCKNIANNPKDFDADYLQLLFEQYADQKNIALHGSKQNNKIKTILIEYGGESVIANEDGIMDAIINLTGAKVLFDMEPEKDEEECDEITFTVQRKYTQEQFDKLPESQ